MKRFSVCYSDETMTWDGSNEPFWDLWELDEDDYQSWCQTVIGLHELDDALRLLGVPEGVVLEETETVAPYNRMWLYEVTP